MSNLQMRFWKIISPPHFWLWRRILPYRLRHRRRLQHGKHRDRFVNALFQRMRFYDEENPQEALGRLAEWLLPMVVCREAACSECDAIRYAAMEASRIKDLLKSERTREMQNFDHETAIAALKAENEQLRTICRELLKDVGSGSDLGWHMEDEGYAERLTAIIYGTTRPYSEFRAELVAMGKLPKETDGED